MALHDQWNIATDDSFRRRVEIAMLNAAIAISSEATATPNHANRAAVGANKPCDWSRNSAMRHQRVYSPLPFALAICANDPTLTPASPDSAIQNNVSAVWNALAGTI